MPEKAGASPELLKALFAAFNRHDVDAVTSLMTEDCVFEAAAGAETHRQR